MKLPVLEALYYPVCEFGDGKNWLYHDATKNVFPRKFHPKIWCLIKKDDCPKFHLWSNQNGELCPTKLGVRSSIRF